MPENMLYNIIPGYSLFFHLIPMKEQTVHFTFSHMHFQFLMQSAAMGQYFKLNCIANAAPAIMQTNGKNFFLHKALQLALFA